MEHTSTHLGEASPWLPRLQTPTLCLLLLALAEIAMRDGICWAYRS